MKWNLRILISIGFIIILILSSYNINAIFPKSISDDIWADGFFNGKISIRNLHGNISGMINLGRSSKKGVFQAKIFFNNELYDAKGWFKEKLIYGTFKNNLISIPLIGLIDLKKSSFEVSLIIPNGNTGEFYSLADDEWKLVLQAAVEAAGDKTALMTGVGHSIKTALSQLETTQDLGIPAVMVMKFRWTVQTDANLKLMAFKSL